MITITVRDGKRSYQLSTYNTPEWQWWFENEDGEGMSVSDKNLFDVLDEYFKEEF